MKILQLTQHFYPFYGGVETHVRELSRRLVDAGHDVEVVCAHETHTFQQQMVDGIKVHRYRRYEPIELAYGVGQIVPQMIHYVLNTDAEVIHAHGYGFFPTWATLLNLIRRNKKRVIITPHSDPRARVYPILDSFRVVPLRLADIVIALTSLERDALINKGVNPKNIRVIPDGVTLKPVILNAHHTTRTRNEVKQIITIGRIDFQNKGQDVLLYAFKRLLESYSTVKLVYIGTGKDIEKLIKIRKRLDLTAKVEIAGRVIENKKQQLLRSSDLFCLSSHTESFGLVLLEAMYNGLPIVSTDVGAVSEVVNNCALLVLDNEPTLLAQALFRVLTDEALAQNMREKGLEHVQKYNWDLLIDKYLELYENQ